MNVTPSERSWEPTLDTVGRASCRAAPVFLLGYGLVRLADGLDGSHGPGPAWTIGHVLFLVGLVLFGAATLGLRRLVPAVTRAGRRTADLAAVLALAGLLAFVRVVIIDVIVGFRAADHAAMSGIAAGLRDVPGVLPPAVYTAGPPLFLIGLLTLTVQLAVLRPRRLPAWSPVLVTLGFAAISVNLDLLPLGAVLLWLALSRVTPRPTTSVPDPASVPDSASAHDARHP